MSGLSVGITGYARTGKNAVAERLVAQHGYRMFSLADGVRDALLALNPEIIWDDVTSTGIRYEDRAWLSQLVDDFGWDRLKQHHARHYIRVLLQRMGTEVGRAIDPDAWIKALEKRIGAWVEQETAEGNYYVNLVKQILPNIVIPDVRFLNEAETCYHVIRVHRPGVGPANGHVSETEVDEITPHDVIVNDGTIDDLHAKVDAIAKGIF